MMLFAVSAIMTQNSKLLSIWRQPLTRIVLLWGLVAVCASVFARYPYGAKPDFLLILSSILVCGFLSVADPNPKERCWIYGGLVSGALILAVWALWKQFLGPDEAVLAGIRENSQMDPKMATEIEKALIANRAMARFGNPNHVAAYLVISLWPCWYLIRRAEGILIRAISSAGLLILLVCIVQTHSRAGVGAAAFVAFSIFFYEFMARWSLLSAKQRRVVWIGGALILIPLAAAAMLAGAGLLGGRLLESKTIMARLMYYRGAVFVIAKLFPWGTGLDGYAANVTTVMRPGDAEANEAHNLFLDAAVEMGPVGLLIFIWLLIAGWRCRTRSGLASLSAAGMLLGYVLVNLADFESELGEFAILFGISLGLLNAPGKGDSWGEPVWDRPRRIAMTAAVFLLVSCWWSLVLGPYMSRLYQDVALAKRHLQEDEIPAHQSALEWQPGDARLMNTYGKELCFRNRNWAGFNDRAVGLHYLEKAVETNPDQAFLYGDLAEEYAKIGRLPEAMESIETAIERFPAKVDYHIRRLELLKLAGRNAEAEAEARLIEKIKKEDKERRL